MKNPQELRQRHAALVQQMTDLYKTASDENRGLSAEERTKFDKMKADADDLAQEIKDVEFIIAADAEAGARKIGKDGAQMYANFDMIRSFKAFLNGHEQRGADAEVQSYLRELMGMNKEYQRKTVETFLIPTFVPEELRANELVFGGGTGTGADVVTKQIQQFVDTLRGKLILSKLGANFMMGLTNYQSIPYFSASGSAYWTGEIGTTTQSVQDMASITLTPKPLRAYQPVSQQLLAQYSGVEQIAFRDLTNAIAAEWESAAFAGTGGSMPMGLLVSTLISDGTTLGTATSGGKLTWAAVNELMTLVEESNIDGMGFATSPRGLYQARTIIASGTNSSDRFISEMMRQEGMKVESSTNVPKNIILGATTNTAMVYGFWPDLLLPQWGPIEIMVDPYSFSRGGQVSLQAHTFVDVAFRRASSFARNKTILIA